MYLCLFPKSWVFHGIQGNTPGAAHREIHSYFSTSELTPCTLLDATRVPWHTVSVTASDACTSPAATTASSLPSLPPACSPSALREPSMSPLQFLIVWENFLQICANFI